MKARKALATAAFVAATTAGCTTAQGGTAPSSTAPSSTTPPTSTAPSTPAAPAVSREDYQALLTAADQSLTPVAEGLSAATTPTAYRVAAETLARALAEQRDKLAGTTPPAEVSAQHRALVSGLREATREGDKVHIPTAQRDACGVENALPAAAARRMPKRLLAESGLERRAKALRDKGYRFGAFLESLTRPYEVPIGRNRQLDTGALVSPVTAVGRGELSFLNHLPQDVVVYLVPDGDTDKPLVAFYVRGGQTGEVRGFGGGYELYVKAGADWDADTSAFTRDCLFYKLPDERATADRIVQTGIEPGEHQREGSYEVVPAF
ncbi:hypothetical protein ACOBQX_28000 [Actinokineospora sp. G85]|uniref:hypothetical protein n=1 Tax=Actinokineospora sp. G85 TaxID=3406626 RepID=UPI003C709DD1